MKYFRLSIIALALFGLAACQHETQITPNIMEKSTQRSKVIDPELAINYLNDLLIDIYDETKADISQYTINDISVFGGVTTKSCKHALPDTTVYIVNFENNTGYAVMAAQSCMVTPVFCITDSGSLSVNDLHDALEYIDNISSCLTKSDIEYNEGDEEVDVDLYSDDDEQYYFTGINFTNALLAASISNQLGTFHPIDSTMSEAKEKYTYVNRTKIGPLLQTKWTQHSPFNDFRNDNAPAGCVAIATAQILECNKYGKVGNRTFDWQLLGTVCPWNDYANNNASTAANAAASDFLQFVGSHNNCRIKYSTKGSSGWAKGAKRTLTNFGYRNVKKYMGFGNINTSRTNSMLATNLPVYVDGSGNGEGHAWVIDGLLVRDKVGMWSGTFISSQSYYHINWGWRGQSDGYFHIGVFNTTDRAFRDEMDKNPSVQSGRYTWNYRVVTYSL